MGDADAMKALSLNQPWAELVACEAKTIETRKWKTNYRGPFYIHASARRNGDIDAEVEMMLGDTDDYGGIDFGALVATANLVDVKTYLTLQEFATDKNLHLVNFDNPLDFGKVRYGFILKDIARLRKPIPCRGMLNFFTVATAPASLLEGT